MNESLLPNVTAPIAQLVERPLSGSNPGRTIPKVQKNGTN